MKKAICINNKPDNDRDKHLDVRLLKIYEYYLPYKEEVPFPFHIIDERKKKDKQTDGYPITEETFKKCFLKIK